MTWAGRDLELAGTLKPNQFQSHAVGWDTSHRPACPKPHPAWPWALPWGLGHPQQPVPMPIIVSLSLFSLCSCHHFQHVLIVSIVCWSLSQRCPWDLAKSREDPVMGTDIGRGSPVPHQGHPIGRLQGSTPPYPFLSHFLCQVHSIKESVIALGLEEERVVSDSHVTLPVTCGKRPRQQWTCVWECTAGRCWAACWARSVGSMTCGPPTSLWPTRWRQVASLGEHLSVGMRRGVTIP